MWRASSCPGCIRCSWATATAPSEASGSTACPSSSATTASSPAHPTTRTRTRSPEEAHVALEAVDNWLQRDGEGTAWELFHENSKLSRAERHATFAYHPSDATVVRIMRRLRRVKPYEDRPKVPLA